MFTVFGIESGKMKWDHAYHRGRTLVQANCRADNRSIAAKMALPKTITQNSDGRRVRSVATRGEKKPSIGRGRADFREVISRDQSCPHALVGVLAQGHIEPALHDHVREHL